MFKAQLQVYYGTYTQPRGISNGTFGKWGDNRGKLRLQIGLFEGSKIALKAPSYKFSLKAHIEGTVVTIMYQIGYSSKIVLLSQ